MRKAKWILAVVLFAILAVATFLFRHDRSDPFAEFKSYVTSDETDYYAEQVVGPSRSGKIIVLPAQSVRFVVLTNASWPKVLSGIAARANREKGWGAGQSFAQIDNSDPKRPTEARFWTMNRISNPQDRVTAGYFPMLKQDPGRITLQEVRDLAWWEVDWLKVKSLGKVRFRQP